MDIMFRSKKSTRVSASSTSTIAASPNGLSSVPYNQIPPTKPAPVAGPSNPTPFANGRRDQPRKEHVSAPLSNPGLNGDGADGRGMPPPSALRSVRESPRNHPDVGGEPEGSFRRATSDASPSNGIRYAAPTIILRRSCTPIQEFGSQTRHPYAAVRDSDAASILTVSSANSGHRPNPDLDRYPSFDPRASVSSRSNGRASVGPSTYAPSLHSLSSTMMTRLSGEFEASRPSDAEVETMFQQLLENRDLNASHSQVPSISSRNSTSSISQSNIAKTTASLPMETKRQMVESDARARWEHQKEMRRKEEEHLRSGKAKRGTAGSHVKNSPEWFLKKVLDGSLTTQHLATLNVSLRTLPLE
jgi:cytokinesis protein